MCIGHLDFKSCLADLDMQIHPAKKLERSHHCEFVLFNTNDMLIVSENGEEVLQDDIGKHLS